MDTQASTLLTIGGKQWQVMLGGAVFPSESAYFMPNLMECQMCGSKAKLDANAKQACGRCSNHETCNVQAPCVPFSKDMRRHWVPRDEPEVIEKAAAQWNRLQTLIARGLMLEQMAEGRKTKGRL